MLQADTVCNGDLEMMTESDTATIQLCREWASAGIGRDARIGTHLTTTLTQFRENSKSATAQSGRQLPR
jgi:hypothetical protein